MVWKNQKPYTLLVGMENGAATMENSFRRHCRKPFLKKLNTELSHDLGILLLGGDPKEMKPRTQIDICSQHLIH